MPVPTAIGQLSTTSASNSPQGSETVGPNMNQYFQAAYAFIAQMFNGTVNFPANLTVVGTITAGGVTCTSDERIKSDWRPLPKNYVDKLADLKSGTFKLDGSRKRRVGVGAQSLRRILPQAVFVGPEGALAVDYGGAAMVSAVELAKEVVALRKEVATLKKQMKRR